VSGTGTELRDLLEAAVGVPPRHVDLAAVRRRVRRRRTAESGAAVMAFALAAVLGMTVFARVSAPAAAPAPLSSAAVHAGEPAHYVQQMVLQKPPVVTHVRATASGKVTATVRCPWRGATIPLDGIAPAGHGVFFVACEQGKYPVQTLSPNVTSSRLYRFRVTAAGKVTDFSLVQGGILGRFSASGVAVTPGGTEAAVALAAPQSSSDASYGVLVINTRTGARALWRMGTSASKMVLSGVGDLSLTSNGRELAFLASAKCPAGTSTGCTKGRQLRAVSPALAGGELASSRLVFRPAELRGLSSGYVNDVLLSPGGSALTVGVIHSGAQDTTVSVVQVSASTGRQLRVLYRVDTGTGMSYEFMSMDPAGRYVMINTGSSAEPHNGWIHRGRLVALSPYDGRNVYYQTW
jgi:hypothetical protein